MFYDVFLAFYFLMELIPMNIKFALGLVMIVLANNIYAANQDQILSTSASGETQVATMDQNGRWQAPEPEAASHSSEKKSTISRYSPFPIAGLPCKKSD